MPTTFDVFVSYSPKDAAWVEEWLLPHLREASLQVGTQEDAFTPGVPVVENWERLVKRSRFFLLVLTPAWVADRWQSYGAQVGHFLDPDAQQRRLIPLLLEPCELPGYVGRLTPVDFSDANRWPSALTQLLRTLGSQHTPTVETVLPLDHVPDPSPTLPHGSRMSQQSFSAQTIVQGDIDGNIFSGNVGQVGDRITHYHGPAHPRPNYRSEVADILDFYTRSFVGRVAELQRLAEVSQTADPGYLLVEAPPGYGKSALVAEMVRRHERGVWPAPVPMLLYFFIRQEGQRHTPAAFLRAISAQLLDRLNEEGGVSPDLAGLQNQFSALWARAVAVASQERPLLLAWCRAYQQAGRPEETPDYVLQHYARHLANVLADGETERRADLDGLVSKRWMDVKFERTYAHQSFAEDVDLAIQVAAGEDPPSWVELVRGCLVYAALGTLATNVPPEVLGVLARVGQVAQAEGYAALVRDAQKCSRSYQLIAEAVLAGGNKAGGRKLLERSLAVAETIRDEGRKAWALRNIAGTLAKAGEVEKAMAVAETIQDEGDKARALGKVAGALAEAGESKLAQRTLASTFLTVRLAGRDPVWSLVASVASILVAVSSKETLWQVYEALAAVEEWWD